MKSPHGDYTIEVDVFSGKLSGLIIAEIELPTVDAVVDIPEWMGKELRPNRLTNAYLSEIDDWEEFKTIPILNLTIPK